MEFDLFTILPLAIAIFVFWRLRSVLGTRTGHHQNREEAYRETRVEQDTARVEDNDNVVTLPGNRDAMNRKAGDPVIELIENSDMIDDGARDGLKAIHSRDPSFDPAQFADGAKMAYEMIVMAFADGDKRTLKNLLARDVYENFEAAIDERADRGESVRSQFVGIDQNRVVGAEMAGEEAQVTIEFVSQIISATLDRDEQVVEGDLQEVAEITDIWTFARSVRSRDPNWKLIATDA